jgi:hypothetical protein
MQAWIVCTVSRLPAQTLIRYLKTGEIANVTILVELVICKSA